MVWHPSPMLETSRDPIVQPPVTVVAAVTGFAPFPAVLEPVPGESGIRSSGVQPAVIPATEGDCGQSGCTHQEPAATVIGRVAGHFALLVRSDVEVAVADLADHHGVAVVEEQAAAGVHGGDLSEVLGSEFEVEDVVVLLHLSVTGLLPACCRRALHLLS